MQVKDIMCTEVKSVPLGTSCQDAFEMMREGKFRHLPILDEEGKVAGIVSDRDLRNVLIIYKDKDSGGEEFFDTEDTKVDQVMAAEPVAVQPDDDFGWAVRLLRDLGFGCLIVSENDRLVGILSYLDVLDVLLKYLEQPAKQASA